jgi:mannosyltransferase
MISSPQPAGVSRNGHAFAGEAAGSRDSTLLLWGIVALGAALRFIALGAKSFWLDEIASVVIARIPGNSFWHWLWTEEGNMALYYVMLRPWLGIHLGESTVRLLSVLPGIASLPIIYLLGRRLFGRNVGLLAALFLALSTCSVVYSQEARGYSWLLLGTIVSTHLFARLIERPTYAMALGYALAVGVTFYFHYFGLLVPLAHAVSLVALSKGRRPWRQLLFAGVIVGAFAVPVLWMVHIQPARHLDWVQKPSLLEIYHLGVFLAAESGKGVGPVLLLLELTLIGVFFQTMLALQRNNRATWDYWAHALVASGLLTPMVFTLLVSVMRPVFFHRFLIICLPAWLLAVAVGASALAQRRMRVLAVAAVCVLSLVSTAISYSREREDWRGVANYIIMHATAQDRVLYYEGVGNFATESYRDWLPGGTNNRPVPVEIHPTSNDWRDKIAGARRVWLVRYPANQSDGTVLAVETELHSRYAAGETTQFRAVTVTEFVAKSN